MKSPRIRTLSLFLLVFSTVGLLMRCGVGDDNDTDNDDGDKPSPTDQPVPKSWDGLSDWTESPWSLEDE